jgi:two-component system response regulator HydG
MHLTDYKINAQALDLLRKYDWPGNIRELSNTCERLSVLHQDGIIEAGDLPENIRNPNHKFVVTDDFDPTMSLHELEKRYVMKAMSYFEGNKTQAANSLGITIKTLYNKLHEYGEYERYKS